MELWKMESLTGEKLSSLPIYSEINSFMSMMLNSMTYYMVAEIMYELKTYLEIIKTANTCY